MQNWTLPVNTCNSPSSRYAYIYGYFEFIKFHCVSLDCIHSARCWSITFTCRLQSKSTFKICVSCFIAVHVIAQYDALGRFSYTRASDTLYFTVVGTYLASIYLNCLRRIQNCITIVTCILNSNPCFSNSG